MQCMCHAPLTGHTTLPPEPRLLCRDLKGSRSLPVRQASLDLRSFEQVEDELFDLPPGENDLYMIVQDCQVAASTHRNMQPACH